MKRASRLTNLPPYPFARWAAEVNAARANGLDVIRRFCTQIDSRLKPGGSVLLEIGLEQKEKVVNFMNRLFPLAKVYVFPDLSNIDRVVYMQTR